MINGQSFEVFAASYLLRSAVKQQLEISGEALKVARTLDPSFVAVIAELPDVIGFRNVLAHEYFDLDIETVWIVATIEAPILRMTLAGLLPEGE